MIGWFGFLLTGFPKAYKLSLGRLLIGLAINISFVVQPAEQEPIQPQHRQAKPKRRFYEFPNNNDCELTLLKKCLGLLILNFCLY
jgi:hypothetical protein